MSDAITAIIPPPALAIRAFGLTDRGLKRETNEDQFLIAELSKTMRVCQTWPPKPTPRTLRGSCWLWRSPPAGATTSPCWWSGSITRPHPRRDLG
ncbi:MAG: hypothetical protein RJA55_2928 [Acidobacteriota bacterium]